jgi:DNA-binding transcriptional MerR regulator
LTLERVPGCRLSPEWHTTFMRSGELARLIGVSTDTLRHYERLGLLAVPGRTNGGYREYSPGALERVRLIRRALSIGFSLSELRPILRTRDQGGAPCEKVRALASAKLREVNQQIRDLIAMRGHLGRMLKNWDARLAGTGKGQPARLLEHMPSDLATKARTSGFAGAKRKKGR